MIVTRLRLAPFAGLADATLSFSPGLNVVVGPNEAGKSTVLRALAAALFDPTDLTPKRLEAFLRPLLPVGGGDTVRVELGFRHAGGDHALVRSWGPRPSAAMTLPGGGVLTAEAAIAEVVAEALGVSEGTFKAVFLARQAALGSTLDELRRAPGAVRDLGDLLGAAIRETDGVSVDALKARLRVEHESYFGRWDLARGMPAGGRGIANPWKNKVGAVLQAYYDRETARQEHGLALAAEARLDELNHAIGERAGRLALLEAYLAANEGAVEGARARRTLELQSGQLRAELEALKKANTDWPTLEAELQSSARQLEALEARLAALAIERQEVEAADKARAVRETLERARDRARAVEAARAARDALPAPSAAEVAAIEEAETRRGRLQIELAAGRLKGELRPRAGQLAVTVLAGVDEPRAEVLGPGEALELEADGALAIEHADWVLRLASGARDFASLAEELRRARGVLEALLAKSEVADGAEARRRLEARREADRQLARAEEGLGEALGGRRLEELEAEAAAAGAPRASRSATEVFEEAVRVGAELEGARERRRGLEGRLGALREAHRSHDALLDALLEARARARAVEDELAALSPLPEGVAEAAALVSEFERARKELEREREARAELMVARAELRLPDRSAEELSTELREREQAFDRTLRRGRSIARVVEVLAELEAEDEGLDPGAALRAEVEGHLSALSCSRYREVRMAETLPAGLVRPGGGVLAVDLLSTGTRAVLGLAVRLAVVGRFLGGRPGFVAMDDPLVDLDPERQRAAAALLRDYAAAPGRQLVVFTCQPAHGALLGGAVQSLPGP